MFSISPGITLCSNGNVTFRDFAVLFSFAWSLWCHWGSCWPLPEPLLSLGRKRDSPAYRHKECFLGCSLLCWDSPCSCFVMSNWGRRVSGQQRWRAASMVTWCKQGSSPVPRSRVPGPPGLSLGLLFDFGLHSSRLGVRKMICCYVSLFFFRLPSSSLSFWALLLLSFFYYFQGLFISRERWTYGISSKLEVQFMFFKHHFSAWRINCRRLEWM